MYCQCAWRVSISVCMWRGEEFTGGTDAVSGSPSMRLTYPSVMRCRRSMKWKCVTTKHHVWLYSCSYSQDYRHGERSEKRGEREHAQWSCRCSTNSQSTRAAHWG